MKTNRLTMKKLRFNAKGKAKKAFARTSHNTGKKSSKRMRHLRGRKVVDKTNSYALVRSVPYKNKGN